MNIPNELYVIIASYLDYKDLLNYISFIDTTLTNTNYITLIRGRFPDYYKESINKYNTKIFMKL